MNCVTCGCGSRWWIKLNDGYKCPDCKGNPQQQGTAMPDWKERRRAEFVRRFGPRLPGDIELAAKYPVME